MSDPFDLLGAPKKEEVPEYEVVGGAFTCQTPGCWKVSAEAKYFADGGLLTWKCEQGHISKIVDFEL